MGGATAGYCVGNLRMEGHALGGEQEASSWVYPDSLAAPLQVSVLPVQGSGCCFGWVLPRGHLRPGYAFTAWKTPGSQHSASASATACSVQGLPAEADSASLTQLCRAVWPCKCGHLQTSVPQRRTCPAPPDSKMTAEPTQVLTDASNGASDYGNKFGEPLIAGFTRSFGLRLPGGERREWLKPIMFRCRAGPALPQLGCMAERSGAVWPLDCI